MTRWTWWKWLVVVNALDLGTSLLLHGADQEHALPEKPAWLIALQLLLLPLLFWLALQSLQTLKVRVGSIAAPAVMKSCIALIFFTQIGHVFLRTEHYPFSAVTMFSNYLPPADPGRQRKLSVFMVDGERGEAPVSFLREGNPYFSRFLALDYKAGWILGTFAQEQSDSAERVAAMLGHGGARNARLSTVLLDPRTGAVSTLPRQALVWAGRAAR